MTISSSVGKRMTIAQMVHQALVGMGQRNTSQGMDDQQWEADFAWCKGRLDLICNELATGDFARAKSFYDLTLVDGTSRYSLPASIIDVIGDGMYINPGETVSAASGETPVTQISEVDWHRLSEKSTKGRVTRFYPRRELDQIEIRCWLIPQEAATIRLLVQRKLADTLDGNATIDLDEFWDMAIVAALEFEIAKARTLPQSIVESAYGRSVQYRARAMGKANRRGGTRARVIHRTGWENR